MTLNWSWGGFIVAFIVSATVPGLLRWIERRRARRRLFGTPTWEDITEDVGYLEADKGTISFSLDNDDPRFHAD